MASIHTQLQQYLIKLEGLLKANDLWQDSQPSIIALSSTKPFALDKLSLEQWLQFIFIPRFQVLLDEQLPLPSKVAVAPYAQEVFKDYAQSTAEIEQLLEEIDELFS
ncbi:YqcC family protein [Celerinatantimonas diazotrophica]|uniref:dTDP-4-dehydrorhamnose 3,5-epimerase n=1 Tax=Celerinatantimonas diazotrophica TaxID=412034 RepID=A0A4R1JA03_9GAMM|nr:YqcC family protein [Celerinatantimonas diazotrophica]TCK47277.1 dTDP-4-dehydrorhamnose 3,5-epimerase [Celerinatantimonas diazotrophica]CAG9296049.1 putative protein YqcC [Celerinatantimonas diazotrophica]